MINLPKLKLFDEVVIFKYQNSSGSNVKTAVSSGGISVAFAVGGSTVEWIGKSKTKEPLMVGWDFMLKIVNPNDTSVAIEKIRADATSINGFKSIPNDAAEMYMLEPSEKGKPKKQSIYYPHLLMPNSENYVSAYQVFELYPHRFGIRRPLTKQDRLDISEVFSIDRAVVIQTNKGIAKLIY
jgi:hypothetical protein